MAEIHIERKSQRRWFWWLLGLAVLLLLAWWAVTGWRDGASGPLTSSDDGTVVGPGLGVAATGAADTGGRASAGAEGAVGNYLTYVDERRARNAGDRNHDYTADGLRRLAGAIGAVWMRTGGNADALHAELGALGAQADSLQRNPESTEHARYTGEAFRTASALLKTVQQRHHPNLSSQVDRLNSAATAVRAGTPLLEQDAQIQRFFDQSADVLRRMSGGRT